MSTISIHNLPPRVEEKLRARARERGLSLNRTVKEILAESLGVDVTRPSNRDRFARFCGIWSEEQYNEFRAATSDLGEVHPGDWE